MKVGRSLINIINKKYDIKSPTKINKQLEELSNTIENITSNLKNEKEVEVDEIVSYQAGKFHLFFSFIFLSAYYLLVTYYYCFSSF